MQFRAVSNPPNPWATTDVEYLDGSAPDARLQVLVDHSRTILSRNDSPDLGFHYSVNPYRGCFHGCAYCYARPSHEYLGFGSGTDFDRTIIVKPEAPLLLREAFNKASWQGELVMFSGVTDCYQPLEAHYRLTRACLEVCAEYKNPTAIITKSPLIERDIDILEHLHEVTHLVVSVSIPFWNTSSARAIEPFVATPERRMRIVEKLSARGVRVHVNVAPVVPGLNDEDIGRILNESKTAGAKGASWILLRLPGPVANVFEDRLRDAIPLRADKVVRRIRETRGGQMYDARFGVRGRGEGVYAQSIDALFRSTARKLGLEVGTGWLDNVPSTFERPPQKGAQLRLF